MKSLILAKNILESNVRRDRFPYKLTFVATYKCQSRCVYCKIWEREPEGELTLDEIQAFFKKSNKFSWVDLTGGEVTLRTDYTQVAGAITTNCKNLYHLHTPTNGLAPALTERRVKEILALGPRRFVVTVSLDGPKDLNDKLRGIEGDFDKVVFTMLGISVPSGPGFVGNYHFACLLGQSFFNVSKEVAAAYAISLHAVCMGTLVFLGFLCCFSSLKVRYKHDLLAKGEFAKLWYCGDEAGGDEWTVLRRDHVGL